ncbi:adenosylmethionine decarboxylase [Candidatus Woesearchaeota archaeon CG10_big_fil_rev_8_21_14_0_10_34_8]|nr:MAG: adenosylmethionine decarboxylase [Candidatus Woesearchaeota archaeon CG10_big_fil_rev_8_21_14_0_10_34_8]
MNNNENGGVDQCEHFGPHLMLDLAECEVRALENLDLIFDILNQLPGKIGMTKITQPYVFKYHGVVPEDWGITGTVIIAESHISIHTFPEKRYVFVDLFSCKNFDVKTAKKYLVKIFKSKKPVIHEVNRGADFPRSSRPNIPLEQVGQRTL